MLKVLVVEDEPPILRGICAKIKQAHTAFEVVGTASNGQEAIDFLNQNNVDIVFTDIYMPILNGIELLKYISLHELNVKTVFLSGYQEFDYAKAALTYGAVDYLLKPLKTDDLKKLLDKLYEEHMVSQRKNTQELLYDSLYLNSDADSSNDSTDIPSICVLLLCIGSFSNILLNSNERISSYWDKINLEALLTETLNGTDSFWIIPGKNTNEKILILTNADNNKLKKISLQLNNLITQAPLPIHIAFTHKLTSINEVKNTYDTLRHFLRNTLIWGASKIYRENADLLSSATSFKTPPISNPELILAVQKGNRKLIQSTLKKTFDIFKTKQITQLYLEIYLKNVLILCNKEKFVESSIADIEFNVQRIVCNCFDYETLLEEFINLMWGYHTKSTSIVATDNQALMEQIDQYIQSHLAATITNQSLSSHFGLTSAYLSKLFKEYKHLTPAEYLVYLRVEKAKKLLLENQDLLAKDIAHLIGYSDPLYFSRVFKKLTGMYPSDFRKNSTPT